MTIWIVVGILALAFVLFGVMWLWRWYQTRQARLQLRKDAMLTPSSAFDPERGRPRPWVIVNPVKHDDLDAFKAEVNQAAHQMGIDHVHWCETTAEDPGTGQAIDALAQGASIIIASGGDGTVRAVAAGVAGSGVRMGIIPAGTGNILARNLGIPINDPAQAMRIALGENHQALDCGWLRVDNVDTPSEIPAEGMLVRAALTKNRVDTDTPSSLDHADSSLAHRAQNLPGTDEYSFVVIAGLGFDGETMAATDSELKKKVGWVAYVVAALGAIAKEGTKLRLMLRNPKPITDPVGDAPGDDEHSRVVDESATISGVSVPDQPESVLTWVHSRTVMFANCGELPFITLAPGARVDDGLIDVIAVNTEAGVLGWADLSLKIMGQGLGVKTMNLPVSAGKIQFRQAEGASVAAQSPQVIQVDGDAIGTARTVHVRLDPQALDIAVPSLEN